MDDPGLGKWQKLEEFRVSEYLIGYVVPAALVTVALFHDSDGEIFALAFVLVVLVPLCVLVALLRRIHNYRKGMWMRMYRMKPEAVVRALNSGLYRRNMTYQRLSQYAGLPNFPLSYHEIFELIHTTTFIRVRSMLAVGSMVEVGPENSENSAYVRELKDIVNDLLAGSVKR